MKNVLINVAIHPEGLQRLNTIPGITIRIANPLQEPSTLPEEVLKTHVLFCDVPPPYFSQMNSLELVQIAAVGYERFYDLSLAEKKLRACNSRGVFDVAIAEWNIAMVVNLARDLRAMIRNQESGTWDRAARFQREIRGSVVGIWGYGGIGRETARLAKALGLIVYVLSRHGVSPRLNTYRVPATGDPEGVLPDQIFTAGQEADFLSRLDFLVLSLPKTKSTIGIVGDKELRALPQTAFVLNPARGPLIQESALLTALREGWIAGAALDTHYHYPMPQDHPLWRFPNVIMTPHISGSTLMQHHGERMWEVFVENVRRYTSGEPLLNELSPSELRGD